MHSEPILPRPSESTSATQATGQCASDVRIPADVALSMISSLLVAREQIIREQQQRITTLEAMLRATAACLRPEGCIIQ